MYWKSLNDLNTDKSGKVQSELNKSKENEFPEGVTDDFKIEDIPAGFSRRKFLALLGASAAVTAAGCSDFHDKGEIIPYNRKPEEITLGEANYYASTCNACSLSCGILIKTREGRPIKVDGNPDHPVSKGKICGKGQANILNLYDPSRITEPMVNDGFSFSSVKWNKADKEIISSLKSGKEIAIIANGIYSPTLVNLLTEFVSRYPTAKVYSYELFNDAVKKRAFGISYGISEIPFIEWRNADVIFTLEGDFLSNDGNKIAQRAAFAERRDVKKDKAISRIYCAEGNMSVTGMSADHRIRIRPDGQYDLVMSIIREIRDKFGSSISLDSKANDIINSFSISATVSKYGLKESVLQKLVNDLGENKGKSIVFGGKTLSLKTQIAINLLNEMLGNTALYNNSSENVTLFPLSSKADFSELITKMNAGNIGTVIHFDSNPVYHFPTDDYKNALKKVKTVVTLTEQINETAAVSKYILPVNHTLESWGDYKTNKGFIGLQQPVISPIYDTRQKEAILLSWMNESEYENKLYLNYMKKYWETNLYSKHSTGVGFDKFWYAALHDGVMSFKENINKSFSFSGTALSYISKESEISDVSAGITVQLTENCFIGDGRFSNNGWLQEIPHPVSKITWDNYAAISEKTAKKLGVGTDNSNGISDVISITSPSKKNIEIPILIQPGVADNFINIELGYGRKDVPVVAQEVGFNANSLLLPFAGVDSDSGDSGYLIKNVKVKASGNKYKLVSTQDHYSFDDSLTKDAHIKRHIIKEVNLEDYKKNPNILKSEHGVKDLTMYDAHEYPNEKWALTIDLNKCIGCGECVSACNVENNIPVVGKDQVDKGREMQWIRVDRYYSGTVDEPAGSYQPMMCQHCDQAPCENVCPVVATTHSNDGLNQMVYNRCVGTRYCSNNCPYKVRRFNFHNFRDHFASGYYQQESLSLIHNPEVTVRSRGVMEKCTFCVHRIMEVRSKATSEGKSLKEYNITTACQDACPTNAIVFGDMNNKESEINKIRKHELGYTLLDELNINPNVTYVAKVKNLS